MCAFLFLSMPKPSTAKKHEKKPKVAYALAYVIIFSYSFFLTYTRKKMQFAGEKRKIPTKQPDFGGLEIMGGV